jgi:hypothetical protein
MAWEFTTLVRTSSSAGLSPGDWKAKDIAIALPSTSEKPGTRFQPTKRDVNHSIKDDQAADAGTIIHHLIRVVTRRDKLGCRQRPEEVVTNSKLMMAGMTMASRATRQNGVVDIGIV